MRISYNWLKDFLPKLTLSPKETAELLTMHSFETVVTGELVVPPDITVVKIVNIKPHPNADRLHLVTVTDGQREITVVCGATNIAVGQTVPYSPPGTTLQDENNDNFTVKETTIRGQTSPGMINSLRELGLHPKEHGGIWILPTSLPLGTKLADHVPPDTILDADVTPNRAPDCLSHRGVARELAALLALAIKEPKLPALPPPGSAVNEFTVTVEDAAKTPRYLGAVLTGVSVDPSPLWLQARLLAAGSKPLGNLVDITNYVMFELGNPTHAFDMAKLPGRAFGIRQAKTGEKIILIDTTEQKLTERDLVITCHDMPIAIAGVMGGQDSGVSEKTKDIFLEVASFNAFSVQETARRLALTTEASTRFSKKLDTNLVTDAARRAVDLLQELTGATLVGILDSHPKPRSPHPVKFRPSQVSRVAGSDIFTAEQSRQALRNLRFTVDDTKEPWSVTVPTDRLDIAGEHDLVEEVIRVTGLENIASAPPPPGTEPQPLPHRIYWCEVVRETLVELGLTETLNYSFEPQQYAAIASLNNTDHLCLVNPVAPDMKNLRVSLLPGLLKNLATNRATFHRQVGRKESSLFEIGHVYKPGAGDKIPGVDENLHLAAAVVGNLPRLEDIAQTLARALHLDSLNLPNIITDDMVQKLKYRLPVFGFEVNLDELLFRIEQAVPPARSFADIKAAAFKSTPYVPLPKYPPSYRDLSILIDPVITIEQVQEAIERVGGQLVADVDLFDEYEPPDSAQKSLAFHITYQSSGGTLTDTEIAQIHNKIVAALKRELGAHLRG